jgi:hypothetical protein
LDWLHTDGNKILLPNGDRFHGRKLVDHIGTKPGVYVMITLFSHPSQDANELPTATTQAVSTELARTFLDSSCLANPW